MASDDLFFLRTGEETTPFVLVTLQGDGSNARGEATLVGTPEGEATGELPAGAGDLTTTLRDANEYALLNGLDLRIDLNGRQWPADLGILGNR
ncbi:hypothetical protein [Aureimonas jatrophae]|jgi:hypothetical protein|uniref:Uncharacterized protein n=1 Tax=Aureimonas jatrophae TaxID=1166073 RepID=A0A1H0HU20_9HYPH|nr:hypothetical protein [Aureimonas jatrophae]MBB3950778.1 hypothetical protein [Aureimonas jatrophae]SDO22686.1 hypothetical protein SAMN05192530_104285 [Aureimonas jatrophae]